MVKKVKFNKGTLAELVGRAYANGDEVRCELIRSKDNDNYLVRVGDERYVLRVYRYQKYWLTQESDYLFELEWLDFLHGRGLSISYPIRRQDGRFLGTAVIDNLERYWALFSFAEGEMGLTPEQAWRFGESIAQIHLASNEFEPSYPRFSADLTWLLDLSLERLDGFLVGEHRPIYEYLAKAAVPLRQTIQSTPFRGDEWGIIGGDFHGDNHHITAEGHLTHFDFDLCSYGWRTYDLAVFRSIRGRSNRLWQQALAGYESVRPLSNHERAAIPTFVLIRHIWVMGSVTTYVEAPKLLASGLWDQWFEKYKLYESGEYFID